jgi:hypothetical protein
MFSAPHSSLAPPRIASALLAAAALPLPTLAH